MTWPEPFTTRAIRTSEHTVTFHALDATGRAVAGVFCSINEKAGCGAFGEIAVAPGGGPRQVRRVMVLLVRAALAYGQQRGIRTVETFVTPTLRNFTQELTGATLADRDAPFLHMAGDLADIQSRVLNRSRDDGEIVAEASH